MCNSPDAVHVVQAVVPTVALPLATGASLTAVIVTVTVATFESRAPSLAVNVKLSAPFALARGV